MIADEQALRGNFPDHLNLQMKDAVGPAADALQPQGARVPTGSGRAKHAAEQEIKPREQHFAAKPKQPPGDAERVLAQSFHA
jgi:hypothetical protein